MLFHSQTDPVSGNILRDPQAAKLAGWSFVFILKNLLRFEYHQGCQIFSDADLWVCGQGLSLCSPAFRFITIHSEPKIRPSEVIRTHV